MDGASRGCFVVECPLDIWRHGHFEGRFLFNPFAALVELSLNMLLALWMHGVQREHLAIDPK